LPWRIAGACGRSRDGGPEGNQQRAVDVDVAFHLRRRKQVRRHALGQPVARRVRGGWRARAEIDHLGALLAGAVHKSDADAAEVTE
jgi:hypothetical protein